MIDETGSTGDARRVDRQRVGQELASRLTSRGVDVRDEDSVDDVAAMEEAVERFEERVQARGGDLMVDEPPPGHAGRPDDPRFRLPLRERGESVRGYITRLTRATNELRS